MASAVKQYQSGRIVAHFSDQTVASNMTKTNYSNISKVCRGLRERTNGSAWKYAKQKPSHTLTPKTQGIAQIDPATGKTLARYASLETVEQLTGINAAKVEKAMGTKRKIGGFIWL